MLYGEASYFDGYHFAHIAEWLEHKRLERIARDMRERRTHKKRGLFSPLQF